MSHLDKDLITQAGAEQIVNAYQRAVEAVNTAYSMLHEAQEGLHAVFGMKERYKTPRLLPEGVRGTGNPLQARDEVLETLKRSAWERIIEMMGAEKLMSNKRKKEMQEQIKSGDLPEVSVGAIMEMMLDLLNSSRELQQEIVRSAYDTIMPANYWREDTKTQERTRRRGVGKKVIMSGVCYFGKWSTKIEVGHYSQDRLAEIDKAFHLLDGKGVPDGYVTPLVDAVSGDADAGETDYFIFKKHKNGNLHMVFKDDRLLMHFNQIAAGDKLPQETQRPN